MLLEYYLDDQILQCIAAENNLAETAFLVPENDNYHLRWFTPAVEVPLCGHATLASAAVVMERLKPERREVVFNSASGPLPVTRTRTGYILNLPARPAERVEKSLLLTEALGFEPVEIFVNAYYYLAVVKNAKLLRELTPNMTTLSRMDRPGVIVTAPGEGNYDFISRYFAPARGIPEDPVTGAAHCTLAPYWSKRLDKSEFHAFQASPRGGEILCRLKQDRVELEGSCVFYLEGYVEL